MACSNHDSSGGVFLYHGEGHKRRGTRTAIPKHMNALRLEGARSQHGKLVGIMSCIATDDDGWLTWALMALLDEPGQALGCLDNSERVHKGKPSLHPAPQARRPESNACIHSFSQSNHLISCR